MAAEVSAVLYAQSPDRQMMAAQKVGTDFLASSHFNIAQDNAVIKGTLKSVFKKDYVPWLVDSKPPGAVPPCPADMLQKDDRYFNEKASETKQAYEYRHLAKPEVRDVHKKLSATNFKMDSDPRLNSFQTSHNRDYTPKRSNTFKKGQSDNPMQSYIPQGDPEKAPEPLSDYRDQYRGYDVSSAKSERPDTRHQGPSTIQGDQRQHHFCTTHNDTFRGQKLPRLAPYPAPSGSNIPQGDQDREINIVTTHQVSFPKHAQESRAYNKTDVMGKLQVTNFKQNDGHGAWNNYLSTMTDSYRPQDRQVDRNGPTKHRNHSDFPVGDDDPRGNSLRANMTTNRFYLGDPPATCKPDIVTGADKRTRSNVWFGEPRQGTNFYETTTDSTFRPLAVPYKFNRPDQNTRGGVPMDYYANDQNNTTYNTDFYNPDKDKMVPNPHAILKLKESHIRAPLGGDRWFATEHLEQFTPKDAQITRVTDPGKLQRSSVPIGTLNM